MTIVVTATLSAAAGGLGTGVEIVAPGAVVVMVGGEETTIDETIFSSGS